MELPDAHTIHSLPGVPAKVAESRFMVNPILHTAQILSCANVVVDLLIRFDGFKAIYQSSSLYLNALQWTQRREEVNDSI